MRMDVKMRWSGWWRRPGRPPGSLKRTVTSPPNPSAQTPCVPSPWTNRTARTRCSRSQGSEWPLHRPLPHGCSRLCWKQRAMRIWWGSWWTHGAEIKPDTAIETRGNPSQTLMTATRTYLKSERVGQPNWTFECFCHHALKCSVAPFFDFLKGNLCETAFRSKLVVSSTK